jgi:DNA-binding LacI/PurR family transcriptional regulator
VDERRRRDATIIDVARLSGVSKSTVSNVIHDTAPVAEGKRRLVLDAIDKLGYRPNALARDLKRRRSATVGVVVGDLADPFFGELTKLIEQLTARANYMTILCDIDSAVGTEREKISLLLEQRVAGILIMYFGGDAAALDAVERAGVPIVGVSVVDPRFDCVATDDAEGARLAVQHLLELGHERIAYLPSRATEASTNAARLAGWEQGLQHDGLPRGPIVTLDDEAPDGEVVTLASLLDSPDRPTAFFAGNDTTAMRLIDRLESAGLRVPGDVSVVGFDDIWLAGLGRVELTTLRQPVAEIAGWGVKRLFGHIDGSDSRSASQVKLPPELVVRGTTAPARS